MKKFDQYIIEAKQVGLLYHFTQMNNLEGIISSNSMKAYSKEKSEYYISFTRMKNYWKRFRLFQIGLVIDGDKLSNRYKIRPFNYWWNNPKPVDEMEEIVKTKEIKQFLSYVKEIWILGPNVQNSGDMLNNLQKIYSGKIKIIK